LPSVRLDRVMSCSRHSVALATTCTMARGYLAAAQRAVGWAVATKRMASGLHGAPSAARVEDGAERGGLDAHTGKQSVHGQLHAVQHRKLGPRRQVESQHA